MELKTKSREATETPATSRWAIQLRAVAMVDPTHLARILTSSIRTCGGWILSRGTTDDGFVNLLFEFERRACVDIYTALIAAGLELSQLGHLRLTELCQCTRNQAFDCGSEVASIELEIQTFLSDRVSHNSPDVI